MRVWPAVALACGACWGGTPAAPSRAPVAGHRPPDVLLVTVDTVRADRIGAYGYARARTPTIDALAAVGRRYARAYSPVPLTIPAHATMMTGLEPWRHGVRSNGDAVLGPEVDTLAEVLHGHGWATGASTAAFVTGSRWGFGQGFDAFHEVADPGAVADPWAVERRAEAVVDDGLAWLATVPPERPWMLWVHLFDAHAPYDPPPGWVDPADPRPYDAEIAYMDAQIARLVAAAERRPAVIAVVGDHGESLGEHGEREHGLFVYEATQRVPWILVGPGIGAEVVDTPVALADVMPVVLDAAGVLPPDGLDGVLDRGPDTPIAMGSWQLPSRLGLAPHLGVVVGADKLIATPRPELYDVVVDPGEQQDRGPSEPAWVAALDARVPDGLRVPPSASTAVAGTEAALSALGYLAPEPVSGSDWPDPKDGVAVIAGVMAADRALQAGDTAALDGILATLTSSFPTASEPWVRRIAARAAAGDLAGAQAVAHAARGHHPDHAGIALRAAMLDAAVGEIDAACAAFEALAGRAPPVPGVGPLWVRCLKAAGRVADAVAVGEQLVAAAPEDASLAGALGVALVAAGRSAEAEPWLRRGAEAAVPEPGVHHQLAARRAWAGDDAGALRHLALEVGHHPDHAAAASAWARLALTARRPEEADRAARAWAQAAPADPDAWHARALASFNLEDFPSAREAVARGLALDASHPGLMLMDANLLVKGGLRAEGEARFAQAQAARQARSWTVALPLPSPEGAAAEAAADRTGWVRP